jgi:hypothetical protein
LTFSYGSDVLMNINIWDSRRTHAH